MVSDIMPGRAARLHGPRNSLQQLGVFFTGHSVVDPVADVLHDVSDDVVRLVDDV